MSGTAVASAIVLIDICIRIAGDIVDIGRAVKDAHGLPPKLRDVLERLPAIEQLLGSARKSYEEGKVTEYASQSARPILEQCVSTLVKLKEILTNACPEDGGKWTKRVWKGAGAVFFGQHSPVPKLLAAIQDILTLLEQKDMYVIGDKMDALQQATRALADNHDGKYTYTRHIVANFSTHVASSSLESVHRVYGRPFPSPYLVVPAHAFNIYPPPERPGNQPQPSSNVPLRRDPDFVDRDGVFNQLEGKCAVLGSWTALVGLGGVGKSQLAIEYAYRVRERSPETWVFWVHASNAVRFEQSFRGIADAAKIAGRQTYGANIFHIVHRWLYEGKNGRWLLILDGVDDARFLLDSHRGTQGNADGSGGTALRPLRDYLPHWRSHCQAGSILITSRTEDAALKLVEQSDVIVVGPMDTGNALALFKKKLGELGDTKDIADLAQALEYMPLAMVQAAACISDPRRQCSARQYLNKFWKSDREKTSLLNHEGGRLRRDPEAKSSVIIMRTWQMSFEHVRATRASAAHLLSAMSMFDRQGVPKDLLWDRSFADGRGFKEDIVQLQKHSLLSTDEAGGTFEMHSLVQLATRKRLEAYGALQLWRMLSLSNLYRSFPGGDYENWPLCEVLFPHVESAAEQQPEGVSALTDWAVLLYRAARYSWLSGHYHSAQELATKSMEARTKLFGRENGNTMESLTLVGLVYAQTGELSKALGNLCEVMETRKRVLGAEHRDTLCSIHNVAAICYRLERWKEAEQLLVQLIEIQERVLEAGHLSTLASMGGLALTYYRQGRLEDAEELQIQLIESRQRENGAEHPDTLLAKSYLAFTYHRQGRSKDAEELQVQAIEASKRVLGPEHPITLTLLGALVKIWMLQGRWSEAKELQTEALDASKRVFGEDHPSTLVDMGNLAEILRNLGKVKQEEALNLMQGCYERRSAVFGPENVFAKDAADRLKGWRMGGTL